MWSFDRVVSGDAYAERSVQPVLHRYNDAKYIWDDASAREWLRGFVRAHLGAEGSAAVPIDLDALDTADALGTAAAPIVLE
jgi:hypothetical protein